MEHKTWHWLNTVLYGEANRCRHPLLPITENVFGGNGIQQAIKTKLPKGFDVHHLDHNRENNDISNLVALPKELHKKYHSFWMVSELDINFIGLIPKSPIAQGGGYFASIVQHLNKYLPVYQEIQHWIAHRDFLIHGTPRLKPMNYE